MEFTLSGNPLKTFHRSITCLARVGTELVLQASPSQLIFHTINSSRSAYQSITLKFDFFDVYTISGTPPIQCSVLLKAVCAILRTSVTTIDRLSVHLPGPDAAKLKSTLECYNGMKKIYWINCNVEPDIQNLSLEKERFPSSLVVRPRDLHRLLANFQSTLQEITIIATEPNASADNPGEIGGKAVELRSYIDPTKDNSDTALHTQLWIDPSEEFLQYTHNGDPVDVTFGVKELKAFLLFCEGCEVDIHLFFEKSGEPILMTPRFGFDDGSAISDFDAKLVLATMLTSQIQEGNSSEMPNVAPAAPGTHSQQEHTKTVTPTPTSNTKIWSDLSGGVHSARRHQIQTEHPPFPTQIPIQMTNIVNSKEPARENQHDIFSFEQQIHMEQPPDKHQGNLEAHTSRWSQHHPSNWLDVGDDEEEEDDDEFVLPTPQNSN